MDWSFPLKPVIIGFYHQWQNLIVVALVLFCTLLVTLGVHFLLRRSYRRSDPGKHVWRDAVLGALNAPLQGMVWIIGLSYAADVLTAGGRLLILADVVPPVRNVVAIVIMAWFFIRLTRRAVTNLSSRARERRKRFDETAADAVGKFVVAVIVIVAALVLMQVLGFSVASLLTFGGVAGIALGFAAQGLVANLLGGITIYASRPFKVGDHIILPGLNPPSGAGYTGWRAGEVRHIGWRATRILDWNGKPFYIPNAKFNTETIINHSRMSFREVSEYVYIRLEDIDKVSAIVDDVNRMLKEHSAMGDYLIFRFDSYGDYALNLYLYAYTSEMITAYTEYVRVKQDLLLKIAGIVAENGAKLAVPVSTVYLSGKSAPRHAYQVVNHGPS